MRRLWQGLAWAAAAVLVAFSLRRALLLAAACLPRRRPAPASDPPPVHILIPCRNEAASLPGLLRAIERLAYPRGQLSVTVVDDGSTDGTAEVARDWARSRPWARVHSLPRTVGKAQALNEALASPRVLRPPQADEADTVIVIYDADHRPAPESLRALVAPFAEPRVAGVSGQMRVVNGEASPSAFYAMIESHVHQLITMRAKDRLALAPALLGSNCAYRLSALRALGGFRPGMLLEDSDVTVALHLAGWRTRFAPESVSNHHAPASWRGHVRQHLRWSRGFHQVARRRLGALWASRTLPLRLKIELTFFALGYADRLALLAGLGLTALDSTRPGPPAFPRAVWAIYFGLPALEMLAALFLAREPAGMYVRLAYVPFFFLLDLTLALWSGAQSLGGRPLVWGKTERTTHPRGAA